MLCTRLWNPIPIPWHTRTTRSFTHLHADDDDDDDDTGGRENVENNAHDRRPVAYKCDWRASNGRTPTTTTAARCALEKSSERPGSSAATNASANNPFFFFSPSLQSSSRINRFATETIIVGKYHICVQCRLTSAALSHQYREHYIKHTNTTTYMNDTRNTNKHALHVILCVFPWCSTTK